MTRMIRSVGAAYGKTKKFIENTLKLNNGHGYHDLNSDQRRQVLPMRKAIYLSTRRNRAKL